MGQSGNPNDVKPRSDQSDMLGTDVAMPSGADQVSVPIHQNPFGVDVFESRLDPDLGGVSVDSPAEDQNAGGGTGSVLPG